MDRREAGVVKEQGSERDPKQRRQKGIQGS